MQMECIGMARGNQMEKILLATELETGSNNVFGKNKASNFATTPFTIML